MPGPPTAMSTEGQSPTGWAGVLNALKDFRVPPQISLGAAGTCAALLVAPRLLPEVPTVDAWRPWLVLGLVSGIVLFLVGLVSDQLQDWLTVRRARRDAIEAVSAATTLAEVRRRENERDREIAQTQIAESAAATARQLDRERDRFFRGMTQTERALCASFVLRGIRSQLTMVTAEALELTRRVILEDLSGHERKRLHGDMDSNYTMSDWAWAYFTEHPDALAPPPPR